MNKRQSKFELLRIILILMVIAVHYFGTGKALTEVKSDNINYYLIHFIESFCIIAVNTFIVMTGYFMVERKEINVNKIIKLIMDMIIYGICIYFFLILIRVLTIEKQSIITLMTSFLTGTNWFIIIYCILYLLIPYVNVLLANLSKKELRRLLIICLVAFCVWPTIIPYKTTVSDAGLGIINFSILYMMGAYIKKYWNIEKYTTKRYLLIYSAISMMTFAYSLVPSRAFSYNSIFNIFGASCLFLAFCRIKDYNCNIVNKLAQNTFGIYIIHANVFISKILWSNLLKCEEYYYKGALIIHALICIIIVYFVSLLLNIIIQKILMNQIYKIVDKYKIIIKVE